MKLVTCEQVFRGHPDKICDQVSDAILTALLKKDKKSRVAVETLVKGQHVVLAGEVTTSASLDFKKIAKDMIEDIGYATSDEHFANYISEQSHDIAVGVDKGGAGDQGIMYGYATDETKQKLPLPLILANMIARYFGKYVREGEKKAFFGKDGKCQVSVAYKDDAPHHLETVVVSIQTTLSHQEVINFVRQHVAEILGKGGFAALLTDKTKFLINQTGEFRVGGPQADAGLTGRKIICDTYGGLAHHGGGAFSGKDPTKVDRSAAYYARYVALHVLEAKLAKRCEVSIAYCIGVAKPVAVEVNTFGTATTASDEAITNKVVELFDMTPKNLIAELKLLDVDYEKIAWAGHFGNDATHCPWEKTDPTKVAKLHEALHGSSKTGTKSNLKTNSAY